MAQTGKTEPRKGLSLGLALTALFFGTAGSLFVFNAGLGAGGAYLLTLISATLLLSIFGGKRRVTYVSLFVVVFFQIHLVAGHDDRIIEWILVIAISVAAPIGFAWVVSCLGRMK
ncbi:MAG: hypothetical protein ACI8UO_004388 [Verrucomicrobiales bacterium]|jgi:hypothetical protein